MRIAGLQARCARTGSTTMLFPGYGKIVSDEARVYRLHLRVRVFPRNVPGFQTVLLNVVVKANDPQ